MYRPVCALLSLGLTACATVRAEDLKSWENVPISYLDEHPVFLTMTMVKTFTPEGTEIRNYVNGPMVGQCVSGGFGTGNAFGNVSGAGNSVTANVTNSANYNAFSTCMQRQAACNNIFYIKNGRVIACTPIGSGGAHCYTSAEAQPGFRGAANIN